MCPLKRVKSRQRLRFSMRHQRFIPSPSQLPPASFSADFSAVAHDRSLLNFSRTAWFDACLCRPTSRGLPSSSSVAPKNRSFSPSFTSHLHTSREISAAYLMSPEKALDTEGRIG